MIQWVPTNSQKKSPKGLNHIKALKDYFLSTLAESDAFSDAFSVATTSVAFGVPTVAGSVPQAANTNTAAGIKNNFFIIIKQLNLLKGLPPTGDYNLYLYTYIIWKLRELYKTTQRF